MDAAPAGPRGGKVSDFRALGRLYTTRDEPARLLFHPFPEGRWTAPLTFLLLLASQPFHRLLVRVNPTWVFAFVVYPGDAPGTIDGFVYLRGRRSTDQGLVVNIGTQVGRNTRGKGVGPQLITALISRAPKRRICRIETQAYAWNTASLRMGEKLGFRQVNDPSVATPADARGVVITHVLDLVGASPTTPREARVVLPHRVGER
jgi:RimJ/RimL family protein N-acetyltransferase